VRLEKIAPRKITFGFGARCLVVFAASCFLTSAAPGYQTALPTYRLWTNGWTTFAPSWMRLVLNGRFNLEFPKAVRWPAVLQCAVIGIPDPQWGEAVHAFVVMKPGTRLKPADLIAFCKERIGGYKCPRSEDVRTDPLPMSGAGKILKRELRRPFWENQKREVA
jgi:hypothetical protein